MIFPAAARPETCAAWTIATMPSGVQQKKCNQDGFRQLALHFEVRIPVVFVFGLSDRTILGRERPAAGDSAARRTLAAIGSERSPAIRTVHQDSPRPTAIAPTVQSDFVLRHPLRERSSGCRGARLVQHDHNRRSSARNIGPDGERPPGEQRRQGQSGGVRLADGQLQDPVQKEQHNEAPENPACPYGRKKRLGPAIQRPQPERYLQ